MAEFSVNVHGYWTNEEYYECVVNNNDNDDDDDEKKEETDNSHIYSIIPEKSANFLDDFVGDDDSSEDIDIDL